MIFLLSELWVDWMENDIGSAMGYKPVGYVTDEAEAKRLVAVAGVRPKGDGWPVYKDTPKLRYEQIKPYVG